MEPAATRVPLAASGGEDLVRHRDRVEKHEGAALGRYISHNLAAVLPRVAGGRQEGGGGGLWRVDEMEARRVGRAVHQQLPGEEVTPSLAVKGGEIGDFGVRTLEPPPRGGGWAPSGWASLREY